MRTERELPPIGTVVEVIQGRDAGLVAVVVGHVDQRFVLIADGSVRSAGKPKKKNTSHIRRLAYVAVDIAERLAVEGKVTNAQLRYAVRRFVEERLAEAEESPEGGAFHG